MLDALTSVRGNSRHREGIRKHTDCIISLEEVVLCTLYCGKGLREGLIENRCEFCFLTFHPPSALPIMSGPVVGQSTKVAVCGRIVINLITVM